MVLSPCAISVATVASAAVISTAAAVAFFECFAFGIDRPGLRYSVCRSSLDLSRPLALTKPTPHALFARLTRRLIRPETRFHASLSFSDLRVLARGRHQQGRALVRLVPPHSRPWRRAVHRPPRPLRHHAGGGRS